MTVLETTQPLTVSVATNPTETRLTLVGEFDVSSVDMVREAIIVALATTERSVDLDMYGVSFIDSSGLGAMVSGLKRAESMGLTVTVSAASREVVRLLEITGQRERFLRVR